MDMTTSYRIQSADRDPNLLLDPAEQISVAWWTESVRRGVSVCRSREDLATYIAQSGIPWDATWVLVELEGYASDDQDEDAQCPGRPELIHPTRIVSVTPIADDFEDEIFAAYDAQYAA